MSKSARDVEALMKRCQIGCGGRNALDEAHSILAECYGTLGSLLADRDRLQRILDSRPAINAGLPETYIQWSQRVYETDIAQATGKQ